MSKFHSQPSPFAAWLQQYAAERNTTLTGLAQLAGLSQGTLRYLVVEPERKPSLETCLRLSAVSGKPVAELLALAGQSSDAQPIDTYHPDRLKVVNMYDRLPPKGKTALLNVAAVMVEIIAPDKEAVE